MLRLMLGRRKHRHWRTSSKNRYLMGKKAGIPPKIKNQTLKNISSEGVEFLLENVGMTDDTDECEHVRKA